MTAQRSCGSGIPSASGVGGSQSLSSNPTTQASENMASTNSEDMTNKLVVTFDFKGNPIGENKSKFKTRCLYLIKAIVGVAFKKWEDVPHAKKEDIWETLLQGFVLPSYHKDTILSQVSDQWRTWKRNIRRIYLGTTIQEILPLKDKVPLKLNIGMAAWNQFIENEATTQKLEERKRNRDNRAKKTDVHLLGSNSYSEVYAEWSDRITGTEDEGLPPTRTNIYLYSRKNPMTRQFHPAVAEEAAKITEIRSSQDECAQDDIDSDALARVKGKDKKGRTRGVGKTSRTKLMAIRPILSELEAVKKEIKQHNEKMSNMEAKFNEKMDNILSSINLLANRSPQ